MGGDEDKATPMFEESLAVAWRLGDRPHTYIALYNLAQVALSRGDQDRAAALFEEAVTLSEQIGDRANVAYRLEGLAVVANARGDAERSSCLIGAAEGLHETIGVPVYVYYEPHRSLYERTATAVHSRLGEEDFEGRGASDDLRARGGVCPRRRRSLTRMSSEQNARSVGVRQEKARIYEASRGVDTPLTVAQ